MSACVCTVHMYVCLYVCAHTCVCMCVCIHLCVYLYMCGMQQDRAVHLQA